MDKGYFPKNKTRGFTLIELMIVMMTMVIVFSVSYARYREFQRRKHLESAIAMIKADLRLAQQMALSGRKPELPAGNNCETNALAGYTFSKASNYNPGPPKIPASYEINAICPAWGQRVLVKGAIELPEDVNLIDFGGNNRIMFRVLARGTDKNSDTTLTLRFVGGGVSDRTITITKSGEIH